LAPVTTALPGAAAVHHLTFGLVIAFVSAPSKSSFELRRAQRRDFQDRDSFAVQERDQQQEAPYWCCMIPRFGQVLMQGI
jgi:hypothetical protein